MSHTVTSKDERTRIHFNSDFSGTANLTRSTESPSNAFRGAVGVTVESFSFDASLLKVLVDLYINDALDEAAKAMCQYCGEYPVEYRIASYWHEIDGHSQLCEAEGIHALKGKTE